MLRGIKASLEKHHNLRILDEAVTATVRLSHRYIAGRQLPDKAVSVLDTACARLSLGQNSTPPRLEDILRRSTRSKCRSACSNARRRSAPTTREAGRDRGTDRRRERSGYSQRAMGKGKGPDRKIRALQEGLESREEGPKARRNRRVRPNSPSLKPSLPRCKARRA
jgi:ATP-dependent Clp protease ATP-binding subunit ClpA